MILIYLGTKREQILEQLRKQTLNIPYNKAYIA